jgi:hypothetical protein
VTTTEVGPPPASKSPTWVSAPVLVLMLKAEAMLWVDMKLAT